MAQEIEAAKDYFGYCILPDKTATPIFEQLLLAIHEHIAKNGAPFEINYVTPAKLAQFYRLVGGDFDRLFLESPPASLSFVYSSLGCQHTLHQEQNLFEPPSIPALTARGYVRWQTIQILLAPAEHVPYIQEAVRKLDLSNPGPGGPFPKVFPSGCLPVNPDAEMIQWHDGVGQKLKTECDPRTRSTSARYEAAPVAYENQFSPINARRRPHIHTSQSPDHRRYSSSDPKERLPKSPHPLRQARGFQRPSVESDTSESSSSESPPPRAVPKIKTPERSPRSHSAARSPYASPGSEAHRHHMGRRHSSHGGEPKVVPNIKESLSPQFYAQHGGRPRPGNAPSPTTYVAPQPPRKSATVPVPERPVRGHRHTVSHDRSRDASWKDKLTAYVRLTADPNKRPNSAETREVDRDMEKDRRNMEGMRYVEGIGAIPTDRRRLSPGRIDMDDDYDSHRRARRERRPSFDDMAHDRRPART